MNQTVPVYLWDGCGMLGSAHTGLVGPFAQGGAPKVRPHRWHMHHRFNRKIQGDPDAIKSPQRIHAGAVSVKRLRGLMQETAQRFHAHASTPLPDSVDLALPITTSTHPRDGTRLLLRSWQQGFARNYAALQQAAVANGRWFPPPASLQLSRLPDGTVTVTAQFAPGYVAQALVLTVCHPSPFRPGRPARPSLSALAAEVQSADAASLAARPASRDRPAPPIDQLPELAQPWAPPGTQLLLTDYVAGFNHHQGHVVIDLMRPGDELVLQPEPHNPHDILAVALYWHHFKLGYVPRNLNQPAARLLSMRVSLVARVVATPASQVPWQRVAFAVFMATP